MRQRKLNIYLIVPAEYAVIGAATCIYIGNVTLTLERCVTLRNGHQIELFTQVDIAVRFDVLGIYFIAAVLLPFYPSFIVDALGRRTMPMALHWTQAGFSSPPEGEILNSKLIQKGRGDLSAKHTELTIQAATDKPKAPLASKPAALFHALSYLYSKPAHACHSAHLNPI